MMRIAVRSDHAGVPLNEAAIAELRSLGHEVVDAASMNPNPWDIFASVVADATAYSAYPPVNRVFVATPHRRL